MHAAPTGRKPDLPPLRRGDARPDKKSHRFRRCVALLLTVAGGTACRQPRVEKTDAASRPELGALVGGCMAVHLQQGCLVRKGKPITLWLPVASTEGLRITVRRPTGERTAATPDSAKAVGGGWQLSVRVPTEEASLEVEAPEGAVAFPIGPEVDLPLFQEVRRLVDGKDDDGAVRRARDESVTTTPLDRAAALTRAGNGRINRGRNEEGDALLLEALEVGTRAGYLSGPVHQGCALARSRTARGRYREAREVLTRVRDHLTGAAAAGVLRGESVARLEACEAAPARAVGDMRSSFSCAFRAQELAERLAIGDVERAVRSLVGLDLLYLGRLGEAAALLRRSYEDGAPECPGANDALNYGLALLMARRDGGMVGLPDAVPVLEQALQRYTTQCPDGHRLAQTSLVLGQAELAAGNHKAARAALARSKRDAPSPSAALRVEQALLEGRILLAEGKAGPAATLFRKAAVVAELDGQRADHVTALEAWGEARAAAGALREATSILERAEDAFDEVVLGVPLGEGRNADVGAHEASTRRLIDVHLRLGDPARALAVARRARARVLLALRRSHTLEGLDAAARARLEEALGTYERERAKHDADAARDWQLDVEALESTRDRRRADERARRAELDAVYAELARGQRSSALPSWNARAGEAYVAVAPLSAGFAVFWVDAAGLTVDRVAAPPTGREAAPLLAPFQAKLRGTERLHVLLPASLEDIDVHAAELDGAPLVSRMAVDYPLDLGAPPAAAAEGQRRALVVGDPEANLPAAAEEARVAAELLTGRGAQTRLLEGRTVDRSTLARALGDVTLFHFAGHAEAAGLDGWDSALRLAGAARFTVADALALPQAPAVVLLSGCEAARAVGAPARAGLGVAQAFVAAGARAAVAPIRPVRDTDAQRFARAFYEALPHPGGDVAVAVRSAQLALGAGATTDETDAGGNTTVDWAAFRVLVP